MKSVKIPIVVFAIQLSLLVIVGFTFYIYCLRTGGNRRTYIPSTESFNQTMYNADTLTRNIWVYIGTNGKSPESLEDLVETGLLDEIPLNPYSRKEMHSISLGETPSFGDYTYIPTFQEQSNNNTVKKQQRGFWLIVYGSFCDVSSYDYYASLLGHEIALYIAYESGTTNLNPAKSPNPWSPETAPEVLRRIGFDAK